jgi:hypothetical protein
MRNVPHREPACGRRRRAHFAHALQDFLWEYDLMLSVHARLDQEEMPRTAMALYGVMKNQSPDAIAQLYRVTSKALRKASDTCRAQPEAMFVKGALVRALDALTR